jgi:CheY-like chemotaxis protein
MVEVLVVEDDPDQRRILVGALGSLGWRVREAATVGEGLRLVRESAPRLVVTDIHLPDGNGFELCRRLREDPGLAGVAIVMVTGTFDPDEGRQRASLLRVDAYLLKPFPIGELMRVARGLVGAS